MTFHLIESTEGCSMSFYEWCFFFFRIYAETRNNGNERKICTTWLQQRFWFRPCDAKVSTFMIEKFCRCFSHSFNVSVDFVSMFLICSMIISFPWLLSLWSFLLKYFQAGAALGFLTSSLWLLSLMLNGVCHLPTYCLSQI